MGQEVAEPVELVEAAAVEMLVAMAQRTAKAKAAAPMESMAQAAVEASTYIPTRSRHVFRCCPRMSAVCSARCWLQTPPSALPSRRC